MNSKFKQGETIRIKRNAVEIDASIGKYALGIPINILGKTFRIIEKNCAFVERYGSVIYYLDNHYWVKENMIEPMKKGNAKW